MVHNDQSKQSGPNHLIIFWSRFYLWRGRLPEEARPGPLGLPSKLWPLLSWWCSQSHTRMRCRWLIQGSYSGSQIPNAIPHAHPPRPPPPTLGLLEGGCSGWSWFVFHTGTTRCNFKSHPFRNTPKSRISRIPRELRKPQEPRDEKIEATPWSKPPAFGSPSHMISISPDFDPMWAWHRPSQVQKYHPGCFYMIITSIALVSVVFT